MTNRAFFQALLLCVSSISILANIASAQSLNCLGTSASDNPAAREEMNAGVDSYKAARYSEAISHFQKATELAPCLTMARSYLGTAQAQNVIPGLVTPDNLKISEQAIANFQIVLTQAPHDVNSLKQVAGIYFSVKRLDDAREWQKKVLVEDPRDPEAAYTIGVIDWTQAHQNAIASLAEAGMQDDGMGDTKAPPEVLEKIKQQNSALVAEALQYLTQAVEIRPNYDDAMSFINLVYRRKADIDYNNPALRDQDIVQAKEWSRKAMLTRKENEERKSAAPAPLQP
ncbi:MAG: tetratricopeptide repeat protein [Terracidiphilus sp.]